MIVQSPTVTNTRTLAMFAGFFAASAILLVITATVHYRANIQSERKALESSERLNVALGSTAISQDLEEVVSDVLFLAGHTERLFNLRRESIEFTESAAQEYKTFITQKRIYDQIRFLAPDGREVVRVNYNNGDVEIVPEHKLQNKEDRYYVSATLAMDRGQTYISPLDLNVEHGVVEQPARPMIRVGTPVFEQSRRKRGIVLVNYFGDRLLVRFRRATANIRERVMLLNSDGYWLSSPRREDEWAFMYGKQHAFSKIHLTAWKRIRDADYGQWADDDGLYTFATVNPFDAGMRRSTKDAKQLRGSRTEFWKVVSHVPADHLNAASTRFLSRYLPFYGLILLLLGVGTFLLAVVTIRHRRVAAQVGFERRFRDILENIDLLAVGVGPDGAIVFVNDALLRVFGWRREQIAGKNWFELFVPEDRRAETRQSFARIIAGNQNTEPCIEELLTADGGSRWVSWNETLLLDAQDQVIGLTRIGEDITDARQNEEQLRKVSQAMEQSPSTVMITDVKGRIEYVNPKFTELTGYSLEEVRGKNPRMLKSGHFSAGEYENLWDTIVNGGEWHGVFQNRKKSGELYWESASIKGVRNESGEITHFIAVKEDITERVRLEERVRLFFDAAPNAMVLVNAEGRIVMVNREMGRCFGYERDELTGQPIEMLIPERFRADHEISRAGYMEKPAARQIGSDLALVGLRKDGTEFPLEIGLNPIDTDEGRFVISAIVDITERKRLEAEVEAQNREIAHNETLAMVGRMASMVAHDLRNPLSSIKIGLQILDKKGAADRGSEEQELKKIALEQVRYMEQILDDLLQYSRPDALKPEWLSVDKLIEPAIILTQMEREQRNARITNHCQPGLPTLHGDLNRLRQALTNLISNAAQATDGISDRDPEIGILTQLDLKDGQPHIRIEICDNGCGIPPGQEDKVFEPFYTTRAAGTGLGLAIAKRVIEQHHGCIELRPNVNAGTCVIVTLPTGPVLEQKLVLDQSAHDDQAREELDDPLILVNN